MDRGSQLSKDDEDDEDDEEDEEEEERRTRQEEAEEEKEEEEKEEDEEATDIKSNNPHLAGGEQNQQQVAINAHAAAETCLNNLTRNFDKAWFDSLNNSFRSWFNHLRTRGAQSKVTCWYCHGCAKIEPC